MTSSTLKHNGADNKLWSTRRQACTQLTAILGWLPSHTLRIQIQLGARNRWNHTRLNLQVSHQLQSLVGIPPQSSPHAKAKPDIHILTTHFTATLVNNPTKPIPSTLSHVASQWVHASYPCGDNKTIAALFVNKQICPPAIHAPMSLLHYSTTDNIILHCQPCNIMFIRYSSYPSSNHTRTSSALKIQSVFPPQEQHKLINMLHHAHSKG